VRAPPIAITTLLPLVFGACAAGGGPGAPGPITGPGPGPDAPAVDYRGVPGFDTRDHPGDGVMARWLEHSPYRWVGYYLPAPCYTGTSWVGKRSELERQGWGTAVLYVGEQDWDAIAGAPALSDSAAAENPRCAAVNLTADQGREHGRAAADATAAEGFAAGSTIFLDVERVSAVSPELAAYVAAWFDAVARDGRYRPGLYAHERNARELTTIATDALAAAGGSGSPRLWVASGSGFDLRAAPGESGFGGATAWQGAFDVRERWGDVTLNIDANVADRASPSAP